MDGQDTGCAKFERRMREETALVNKEKALIVVYEVLA